MKWDEVCNAAAYLDPLSQSTFVVYGGNSNNALALIARTLMGCLVDRAAPLPL